MYKYEAKSILSNQGAALLWLVEESACDSRRDVFELVAECCYCWLVAALCKLDEDWKLIFVLRLGRPRARTILAGLTIWVAFMFKLGAACYPPERACEEFAYISMVAESAAP